MNTLKDFYNFYKEIPENGWCEYNLINHDGQCCANGLIGARPNNRYPENVMTLAELLGERRYSGILADVNNGFTHVYTQPTPKQRVLAFLKDKIRDKEDSTFNG